MDYRKSLRIAELKAEKAYQQGWKCPVCGEHVDTSGELAHKIPQSKWALRKYGEAVIHHPRNMVLVHPQCNDYVSLSNHPVECDRLALEIHDLTAKHNVM